MLRFLQGGGNHYFSLGIGAAGIWAANSASLTSSAPAGRSDTYALTGGSPFSVKAPALPSTYAGLISGYALYLSQLPSSNAVLIQYLDGSGNVQCDVRLTTSGKLIFTQNGTQIGSTSSYVVTTAAWIYIEFKALFGTSSNGTCEVKVNGTVELTATSVTNASGSAVGGQVIWEGSVGGTNYMRDFYTVDTVSGLQTSYLDDISVVEIYGDAAGVNSAWSTGTGASTTQIAASGPASFSVSAYNGAGVFTGVFTGGGSNAYEGYYFTITGTSHNNGTYYCTASSATQLTVTGGGATSESGLSADATFECQIQPGIHGGYVDGGQTSNVGTRPNGDNLYIYSSSVNAITDFAHQTLSLTGQIAGVVHVTYARKDDSGTRQISQICLSSSTQETSAVISLGSSYQYYFDVLESDPNTGSLWGVTGFNNATFGVEEMN